MLKNTFIFIILIRLGRLSTKAIESSALSLKSIDDVHSSNSLSSSMLSVGYSITNDVFEEDLQDTTSFFVDKSRDTFNSSSSGETSDSRLSDTLDVITQDLSMSLGSSLYN